MRYGFVSHEYQVDFPNGGYTGPSDQLFIMVQEIAGQKIYLQPVFYTGTKKNW